MIDRRLVINDRGDASGGTSLLTAVRELRSDRYDVAIDLQGLIKSALLVARVRRAARDRLLVQAMCASRFARLFYTDIARSRAGRASTRRARRGTSSRSISDCSAARRHARRARVPDRRRRLARSRARCSTQTGGRYALLNPGRRLAEQALAAGSACGAGRGAARAARADVGGAVGSRRARARRRRSSRRRRRRGRCRRRPRSPTSSRWRAARR